MSRTSRSEATRLEQAREAQRAVAEELNAKDAPRLTMAKSRAAARLGISTRTLFSRLADVPVEPTPADIGAALVKLAGSGVPGTRGLDKIVATLERYLDPDHIQIIDGGEW